MKLTINCWVCNNYYESYGWYCSHVCNKFNKYNIGCTLTERELCCLRILVHCYFSRWITMENAFRIEALFLNGKPTHKKIKNKIKAICIFGLRSNGKLFEEVRKTRDEIRECFRMPTQNSIILSTALWLLLNCKHECIIQTQI